MKLKFHICEWEFRTDPGEEEHGPNTTRRFCKICNRRQNLFYYRFGNVRYSWKDEVKPEEIKLP